MEIPRDAGGARVTAAVARVEHDDWAAPGERRCIDAIVCRGRQVDSDARLRRRVAAATDEHKEDRSGSCHRHARDRSASPDPLIHTQPSH